MTLMTTLSSFQTENVVARFSSPIGCEPTENVHWSFQNGYGASVRALKVTVMDYTRERAVYTVLDLELAVLKFTDGVGKVVYTTPIADDVVRFDTPDEMLEMLDQISKLAN